MKKIDKILMRFVMAVLVMPAFTVSCSDEPLAENYYTFTGEMVTDYLQNRSGEFSDFIAILQRSGMYGMMAATGAILVWLRIIRPWSNIFMNWGFKVWTNLQRNSAILCHGPYY